MQRVCPSLPLHSAAKRLPATAQQTLWLDLQPDSEEKGRMGRRGGWGGGRGEDGKSWEGEKEGGSLCRIGGIMTKDDEEGKVR